MRIGAAVIVVVFLFTGCASQPESTPSSTPDTEASRTPPPPSAAPRAVFDVGCAELVSTETLGALFDPSLTSGQTVALRRDEE